MHELNYACLKVIKWLGKLIIHDPRLKEILSDSRYVDCELNEYGIE